MIKYFKSSYLGVLLAGFLSCVYFLLIFSFEEVSPMARLIDFWVPGLVMFFFIRMYKQNQGGGYLHFWQGLLIGNIIGIGAGLVSAGLLLGYLNLIDKTPFENYIQSSLLYLKNSQPYLEATYSKKEYKQMEAEIRSTSTYNLAFQEIKQKFFYCFVLVPLTALINRKTKPYR